MTKGTEQFSAAQRETGDGPPGATAAFPYDRMTVERFRAAFPRARRRDGLGAWFVPGVTAERRLNAWSSREWSGVLAHADQRGRDAFAFEPVTSPYLEVGADLSVRTPYSREVVAELRQVPRARWDPASKTWRVPFRSLEDLRRRWPAIEAAARRAEPKERRKRAAARKASPEHGERLAEAAERRRARYPVPEDALPPVGDVLMTHAGSAVFEAVTGEVVNGELAARFYPGVMGGPARWFGRPVAGQRTTSWCVPGPRGRRQAGPSSPGAGGGRPSRSCAWCVARRHHGSARRRRAGQPLHEWAREKPSPGKTAGQQSVWLGLGPPLRRR